MRLTQFSDNALRCLLALGLQPEQVLPVNVIAVQMGMSHEHLMKVVHRLHDLGYVETRRGRHGGVRLRQLPAEIVLGTVIRQTEDNLDIVECFNRESSRCPIESACQLAGMLDEALSAFLAVLDRYTLADALENRGALVPLLRGARR
jgi:Rrf2 family transcriptional regulator, nitric oxide-sensitive transcriptional repressor